ncbi:MAG: hypothetical protein COY42_24785 [Armatimonadetes bacterium CG_4_10_14_0_8_um_filter_66_14]|nr:family 10 glycosylhydrolase [Armatimonadota bacterium]OIO92552.1 MAG: hypothetical protein AUJ96_32070 [Armatimonadetes bacterium CG2_30_66_41]PIU91536.1 MAG: hypothetical protein COS65_21720 [Armatimonadetes bacterium CG06_land_8_20_14_3_00_66_21]PIX48544.1 MAG: hypothetical protein COZ57_05290 [Armatimonadetes bacterium CG_4_8_14_3_um_filter_66_20]PIZ36956.1 MAG: hypothetical protein COY42_24785 [Armatimonadetes bacterium CG_4_10_14_0_8_um_filter_66_14]PJB62074.1 MAG: hypothetical protein
MTPPTKPLGLSPEHNHAADRRRRIIVQYDAMGNDMSPLTESVGEWLSHGFRYVDEPGSQIDSVFWDCAYGNYASYPSEVLPPSPHPAVRQWLEGGVDWMSVFVEQTHRRGLEAFWHHRIAEVDVGAAGLERDQTNPIKQAHPEWLLRTWWWQGLWNLSVAEVREFKVAVLRELAERYDFDGFQLDFARHVPVLPVGRQWELREHVTELTRLVRRMLLEVAAKRGRPLLLAAKVPRNFTNCRADGFDVETWVREGLVDLLTLGSRSFDVDVAAFRETLGPGVKLYPCIDDHHASDGYRNPPAEVFRGVATNWWQQGADGIVTFNWHAAPPEVYAAKGATPGPVSQQLAYHELGSPKTLAGKSKVFPVERRGGYPWAEGAFNQNADAQLPALLRYDGTPAAIALWCGERRDEAGIAEPSLTVRVTLSHAEPGDQVEATLNGQRLANPTTDHDWKDPQIPSPGQPARPSGGDGNYRVDPQQKLCLMTWTADPAAVKTGRNEVCLSVLRQAPHLCRQLCVEKVELHLGEQ